MRMIFRVFVAIAGLAVLLVAGLVLLPSERIASLAASQFETATGRTLDISGTVRPTVWPVLGVRADGIAIGNADWSVEGPMVQAETLDIGVDLAALIQGNIVVRQMEFGAPQILLERHADGRANWDFTAREVADQRARAGDDRGARDFSVESATVADGALTYIDHGEGSRLALTSIGAELRLSDLAGPAHLIASGRLNGQPLELDVKTGAFEQLMAGRLVPLEFHAVLAGTRLRFQGRAGSGPLSGEGQAELALGPLPQLLSALGQPAADLPAGLGPVNVDGRVTLAPSGSVYLREAGFDLGTNRLTGAADLAFDGPRPMLTAQLSAGSLNFADLFAGGGQSQADSAQGWSTSPIDVSALAALDAEVLLEAASVNAGLVRTGATRVMFTLNRSRGVFDIRELRLFDGLLAGEFVVNGRGGLSVGGDLHAEGVNLQPLLRATFGMARLAGTGGAELRFLGVGNSVDAIMRSLSGQGVLRLGQGEIIGFDLAGMLRSLDMSYMGEGNRTIYDSITGSFSIDGGTLRNDDLRLVAQRLTVNGRGTVGLGARTLDYRVIPVALADEAGTGGVRVPLLVTGPWSAPRFRLDLEGLAEERLRQERERLEALAREEAARLQEGARQRVEGEMADRLGVERQEGESLEDAARRALEESGIGDVLRLFGD